LESLRRGEGLGCFDYSGGRGFDSHRWRELPSLSGRAPDRKFPSRGFPPQGFAEWRRRELLRTTVAGSSPAGGESCRSSNGRAKRSGRWFPLQKDSGVVKVRVTSVERPGEELGRCEFDARLLRGGRAGLKTGHYDFGAIAQRNTDAGRWFPSEKERAQPGLAVPPRCRDGAEKSYFVCHTMWG
jgi:hypothetical protein